MEPIAGNVNPEAPSAGIAGQGQIALSEQQAADAQRFQAIVDAMATGAFSMFLGEIIQSATEEV